MIIKIPIEILCSMLHNIIQGLQLTAVPLDGINVLAKVTAYGSYVVGSDLLLLFASVVFSWTLVKLTIGLGLFIWKLLPFT